MSPDEIYYAEADDASGSHPVVVVSRSSLNRGDSVVCVLCTTANFERRRHFPSAVPFQAGEFGFPRIA
jgi:mRNA-degrading endonuclease toxin of MazEF toxin-antitoxin module